MSVNRQPLYEWLGIKKDGGLQFCTWSHHISSLLPCVLCRADSEMDCVSSTLFDGDKLLGDLCYECIQAGRDGAVQRMRDRVDFERMHFDYEDCEFELRSGRLEWIEHLAKRLSRVDPNIWPSLRDQGEVYAIMEAGMGRWSLNGRSLN